MPESLAGATGVAALLSALALIAVWIPFQRGLRVCARAAAATRRVPLSQLKAGSAGGERTASLALLMLQVLRQALRDGSDQPREFLLDATRQYVVGEWETHYARLISMYANILPPIGFIGTTGGLLVLFLSRRLEDASLELGALAVALVSSVLALVAFAVLESMKIKLYGRLLLCLEDVNALLHSRPGAPSPPARGAAHPA